MGPERRLTAVLSMCRLLLFRNRRMNNGKYVKQESLNGTRIVP